MRNRTLSNSGFSVIELTITVLVMGILAGIVAPSYVAAISRYRVDSAARRIKADLQYAQSEAQRNGQSRTVQFEVSNDRYTLVNVSDINVSANAYTVELAEDPLMSTLVSASFGVDTNVLFNMYGRPDTAGSVVVQSGTVQKTITLSADGTVSLP